MTFAYGDVMLVDMRWGERRFLYRGTLNAKGIQPYELQPSVSPDDRWVLLKDEQRQCVLAIELDQHELQKFLS